MPAASTSLVAEATRRSAVVWVGHERSPDRRAAWHLWHAGCAWLVTGGLEQPLPDLLEVERAVVAVRSKERQGDLLVEWTATVGRVQPGTPEWNEVVPLLHAKRLNAPDGEGQPARWARESVVLRFTPTGDQRRP